MKSKLTRQGVRDLGHAKKAPRREVPGETKMYTEDPEFCMHRNRREEDGLIRCVSCGQIMAMHHTYAYYLGEES